MTNPTTSPRERKSHQGALVGDQNNDALIPLMLSIKDTVSEVKVMSLHNSNQITSIQESIKTIEGRQKKITEDVLIMKNDAMIKLLKGVFVAIITTGCGGVAIWALKSAFL